MHSVLPDGRQHLVQVAEKVLRLWDVVEVVAEFTAGRWRWGETEFGDQDGLVELGPDEVELSAQRAGEEVAGGFADWVPAGVPAGGEDLGAIDTDREGSVGGVVAGAGVEVLAGVVDEWGRVGVERDEVCFVMLVSE
jgi:hypothetical protein